MRLLGAIIIIIPLIGIPIVYNRKDLLAPTNVFSLIYFMTILLPTLLFSIEKNIAVIGNSFLRMAVESDSLFLKYCILQTCCYYLVLLGTTLHIKKGVLVISKSNVEVSNISVENRSDSNANYLFYGIVFTLIGFISFLLMMNRVGGIYYFFTHLQYRSSLTRDLDLLSWLLPLLQFGPLLIVYSLKGKNKHLSVPLILLLVLSGFCSGLGGRKAVVLLLFEAIIIFHFCVKQIKYADIMKPKFFILGLFIILFFVIFVQFRTEGSLEQFLANPVLFIQNNNHGILRVFTNESYVPFYIMTLDYFSNHPYWLGSSYLGLVTAIIPSSIYPLKPPVDDGMYLYSICQGRLDIDPIMATSLLNGSSYPLETFGSTYANFGLGGLFIGMILLGVVYGLTYRQMHKHHYSFFWLIIYSQILFSFEFSTLRIFQLFQTFVMAGLIIRIIKRFPFTNINR